MAIYGTARAWHVHMYFGESVHKWLHVILSTKRYNHLNHSIWLFWPQPSGSGMVIRPKVAVKEASIRDTRVWGEGLNGSIWRGSRHWRRRNTMIKFADTEHENKRQLCKSAGNNGFWLLRRDNRDYHFQELLLLKDSRKACCSLLLHGKYWDLEWLLWRFLGLFSYPPNRNPHPQSNWGCFNKLSMLNKTLTILS